jgi:hypothetical protein
MIAMKESLLLCFVVVVVVVVTLDKGKRGNTD